MVDRLPTQSAVGVLRAAKEESARNRPISTGLANLDAILRPRYAHSKTNSQGGLAVGQITEVIGPPGIGRTALW